MSKISDIVRDYKKNEVFNEKGIDYARVIATRAYMPTVKGLIYEFIRMIAFQYDVRVNKKNESIMAFIYSYRGKGRPDFDYIFDNAVKYAEKGGINVDVYDCVYRFKLCIFRNILNVMKRSFKYAFHKVKHPVYAAILVSQFVEFDDKFKQIFDTNGYKACVSFCDFQGIENEFVQIARQHSVKTATLQHGQYRVLPWETEIADIESYENFISDYLLSWGEKTSEEFVKAGISKDRILLAGAIKPFSHNQKMNIPDEKNVFGVVLSGNFYEESNIKMIKMANLIAKTYDMKYILRMHPKSNEKKYLKLCDKNYLLKAIKQVENTNYASQVDFSILHMTGVFVELLSINSPIFVLNDKYMVDLFKLENASFTTFDDFNLFYSSYRKNKSSFLENQYKQYKEFNCAKNLEQQYIKLYKEYLLLN